MCREILHHFSNLGIKKTQKFEMFETWNHHLDLDSHELAQKREGSEAIRRKKLFILAVAPRFSAADPVRAAFSWGNQEVEESYGFFLCLKMERKWHVQEKPMIDDHNEDRRELLLWCKIGTRCSESFSWSAAVAKHSLATSPWVSQNVFKWYKLPARSKDLNLKTNWLGSGF